MNVDIDIKKFIGRDFYDVFWDLRDNRYFEYWLKGGRGSLKTSFAFLDSVLEITLDAIRGETSHMIALRKIKDTIRSSVFNDVLWALNTLRLRSLWKATISPMEFTFKDSKIIFAGCANQQDYEKIKGIKFEKGKVKRVIFEEITEFNGYDEVLSIIQSLFRGTDEGACIFTYNPPASKSNWVNLEVLKKSKDRLVHDSSYLNAPPKWLGKIFLDKAEHIRLVNPRQYNHMYLGETVGEGLEIYPNVEIRDITDQEIASFTQITRGLDFGHVHSTCYSETYYNKSTDTVYVFDEVYSPGLTNATLARLVKQKAQSFPIRADNENPNLIMELSNLGLNIIRTHKGKGSKEQGIKWLADRAKIVIDKKRCPNIAEDFTLYEFKKDKNGNKILEYPDEPDGSASVRYSLEHIIQARVFQFVGRK